MPEFIGLAKKHAERVDKCFKHCCIIHKGGNILGIGVNDSEHHAEDNAIHEATKADFDINGARFISIRITKGGSLGNAKPCPKCAKLLKEYKMRGWYSNGDSWLDWWDWRVDHENL
jgi:pyrimidine deaminase RibD-like protein